MNASFVQAEGHQRAEEVDRSDDGRFDVGFLGSIYGRQVREVRRIIQEIGVAAFGKDTIAHRRTGENDVQTELPFQPFLHHLKMKKTQKTATKPETQSGRRVLLPNQGGVVEFQLVQGRV